MNNKYELLGSKIGKIVDEKNKNYGSAFHECSKILEVLYPNGIKPEQYSDLLAMTRIIDKLFRIANNPEAYGEDPTQDLAGYCLLWNDLRSKNKATAEIFKEKVLKENIIMPNCTTKTRFIPK